MFAGEKCVLRRFFVALMQQARVLQGNDVESPVTAPGHMVRA